MRALGLSALPVLSLVFMAIAHLGQAQNLGLAPARPPTSYGTAIDQGIAYVLMLVALAITYMLH